MKRRACAVPGRAGAAPPPCRRPPRSPSRHRRWAAWCGEAQTSSGGGWGGARACMHAHTPSSSVWSSVWSGVKPMHEHTHTREHDLHHSGGIPRGGQQQGVEETDGGEGGGSYACTEHTHPCLHGCTCTHTHTHTTTTTTTHHHHFAPPCYSSSSHCHSLVMALVWFPGSPLSATAMLEACSSE